MFVITGIPTPVSLLHIATSASMTALLSSRRRRNRTNWQQRTRPAPRRSGSFVGTRPLGLVSGVKELVQPGEDAKNPASLS
jgi:hypothetical protein